MTKKALTLSDYGAEFVEAAYGETLRSWRQAVSDLVIVGGAVRDTIFGRHVKDIDLMSARPDARLMMQKVLGQELYPCLKPVSDSDYESEGYLIEIFETQDRSINLLIVTSIVGRVLEFPDSISKVWFDGERVQCTRDFEQTVEDRVIRTYGRMTPERLARLQAKYPDFEFHEELA